MTKTERKTKESEEKSQVVLYRALILKCTNRGAKPSHLLVPFVNPKVVELEMIHTGKKSYACCFCSAQKKCEICNQTLHTYKSTRRRIGTFLLQILIMWVVLFRSSRLSSPKVENVIIHFANYAYDDLKFSFFHIPRKTRCDNDRILSRENVI